MNVFLKKNHSYDSDDFETILVVYQNYLINTLNCKIKLNIIHASDTVGISSSHTSGNKRWKSSTSVGKKYFSSPLKLKKKSIKQYSLPLSKPLTKKEKILQTIESKCINMKDPITQQDFIDFPRKKLDYLIYIQTTAKKYHCFYVKSLYAAMNNAIQSGEVFKNPLNKEIFSKDNINAIMTKMKKIYPAIEIPRKKILYRDDIEIDTDYIVFKNIRFLNIQVYYNLDRNQTYHNVYHILKDISIPLHIDDHPSLSCAGPAILIKITDIIAKGKFMSLTIPFTFHHAFESNIYADDWFDKKNIFKMDKYNAFCAML